MEAIMDRSVVEEITVRFQALVSIAPLSAIHTPERLRQGRADAQSIT